MRVLVVFEPGRSGAATLAEARSLAERDHAELTVVGVAPTARSGARCGNSALEFNDAVAESVLDDLGRARAQLGELPASYRLLVEGSEPSLDDLARGFDVVLLPARRRPFRTGGHPAAARLTAACGAAEVRVVDGRRSAGVG